MTTPTTNTIENIVNDFADQISNDPEWRGHISPYLHRAISSATKVKDARIAELDAKVERQRKNNDGQCKHLDALRSENTELRRNLAAGYARIRELERELNEWQMNAAGWEESCAGARGQFEHEQKLRLAAEAEVERLQKQSFTRDDYWRGRALAAEAAIRRYINADECFNGAMDTRDPEEAERACDECSSAREALKAIIRSPAPAAQESAAYVKVEGEPLKSSGWKAWSMSELVEAAQLYQMTPVEREEQRQSFARANVQLDRESRVIKAAKALRYTATGIPEYEEAERELTDAVDDLEENAPRPAAPDLSALEPSLERLHGIRKTLGFASEGYWPNTQRYKIKTAIDQIIDYLIDSLIVETKAHRLAGMEIAAWKAVRELLHDPLLCTAADAVDRLITAKKGGKPDDSV